MRCVDPVRNPYAPGAGQRPPELAGRGRELDVFDVVLERIARGRPERSLVLTGLRGVGKTVLLNTLRSQAIGRLWGTGKIEARPDQSLRRPIAAALHMAVRELRPAPPRPGPHRRLPRRAQGVRAAGRRRPAAAAPKLRDRWQPGIDVPAASGRADSGDIEIDLVELFTDAAERGHRRRHRHRPLHRRDAGPRRRRTSPRSAPPATSCPSSARR